MSATVTDLGERREVRRMLVEVRAMNRRLSELALTSDERRLTTTVNCLIIELRQQHATAFEKLRPVLMEWLLLNSLVTGAVDDKLDAALKLGLLIADFLNDSALLAEFPQRLASRRSALLDDYERVRREYGEGLFEQQPGQT